MKFGTIGIASLAGALAVLAASPDGLLHSPGAQETLDDLAATIAETIGVQESAILALDGTTERIEAAVAKALENGATAEQLAPITDEIAAQRAKNAELAAAVARQTGDAGSGDEETKARKRG